MGLPYLKCHKELHFGFNVQWWMGNRFEESQINLDVTAII